jgi:hypothetical protein
MPHSGERAIDTMFATERFRRLLDGPRATR